MESVLGLCYSKFFLTEVIRQCRFDGGMHFDTVAGMRQKAGRRGGKTGMQRADGRKKACDG